MSARNRELLALIPVAVLITAGFTAVFVVRSDEIGDLSLIYGGYFLALCLAAHVLLRIRLPHADPYLFPLCALLAAVGLVVLYRIDDALAGKQATVFLLGLVLFALTIIFLRDYDVLERYRYLIALGSLALLMSRSPAGDRRPGDQRGVPEPRLRPALVPARRGGEDRRGHLPRQLPRRASRAALGRRAADRRADDSTAQAPRSAARRLGGGDGDAGLHPRPRQLADVLRRLPGGDLRRHRAALLRADRARRCSSSAPGVLLLHSRRTSRNASTSGSTRSLPTGPRGPGRSSSRCSPRPTVGCSGPASVSRCCASRGRSSPRAAPRASPTAAASFPSPTPTSSTR